MSEAPRFRERELHKSIILSCICIIIAAGAGLAKSGYTPEERLVLADRETFPPEAVKKYKSLVDKFRHFKKNDYAQHRICEIHYLAADWQELKNESLNGKKYFTRRRYRRNFMVFLVLAELELGEYDEAQRECERLIALNHDYNNLAAAILLLAQVHKKKSGFSKQYIITLRQIASGFPGSNAMQTALFLLGEFYENKKMYDESYSAYSDLVSKYPGSPEAAEATKRIGSLMKYNPRSVYYLPGKQIIDETASIDISPETDLPHEKDPSVFYSLSVGPFNSQSGAAEIKKLLAEYDFIKTVRLKKGYAVYVSRCPDEDSILKIKIRLAEEYGINGRIVRIFVDEKNSYIYGD